MKNLISFAAVLVFIFFSSCDGNSENKVEQAAPLPSTLNTNPLLAPSTDTSNKGGNVALNPKHGEPGHRCDIAVGAPLNSPAGATNQNSSPTITSSVTNPAGTTNPPLPATNSTATGLNPQHGQPGHRCDIAVGAPLNSKPQ